MSEANVLKYTEDEIKAIVSEEFEKNGIDIDDRESLEHMNSLEYISILVALEERFEIEFPDVVLTRNLFVNMEDFYQYLGWLLGLNGLDEDLLPEEINWEGDDNPLLI